MLVVFYRAIATHLIDAQLILQKPIAAVMDADLIAMPSDLHPLAAHESVATLVLTMQIDTVLSHDQAITLVMLAHPVIAIPLE